MLLARRIALRLDSRQICFRRYHDSLNGSVNARAYLVRQGIFAVTVSGLAFAASAVYKTEQQLGGVRRFWNKVQSYGSVGQTLARETTPTHTIIGINTAIFGAWIYAQTPAGSYSALRNVLESSFTSRLFSPRGLPMLLSSFSHASLGHFLMNNIALHSFGRISERMLSPPTMAATFVAGGTLSSYGANIYNYIRRGPGYARGGMGSSGALLTFLAISSTIPGPIIHPIGLPMLAVSGLQAVCLISAIDVVGLVRGWTMIGHAAHLSGTLFGLWIAYGGGFGAIRRYEEFVASQYYSVKRRYFMKNKGVGRKK
jgi:membrane associated rhomboid family serine protease